MRFENRFNRAESIGIISNSTRSIIISNQIPRFISVRRIGNNDIGFEQASGIKNIFKDFARIFQRFDISKMRSKKFAIFIVVRVGKEGLRAKAVEGANRFNVRKNRGVREPAVS